MAELESIRLDKWLWTARFFKTRKLASDAVSGGKVHLNGQRCKPSKDVKIGTTLRVTKENYHWDIEVVGINSHRRPAKEAILLYTELQSSIELRQTAIIEAKEKRALTPYSEREQRPNKKQRRQIHRFTQKD